MVGIGRWRVRSQGAGGVVTIPALGSTTPIIVLGQLLEGGVSGNLKPIFYDKGITLI
jgi:hypothetical protein